MDTPSPYAPRTAPAQVSRITATDPGLLPVDGKRSMPHLRRPCVFTARADLAEWDPETRDFVPALNALPVLPGANGVGLRKDPQTGAMVEDVSAMVSDLQVRRFRVLVNGDPALEPIVPGGRFLQIYPCQRNLTATVPIWESPGEVYPGEEVRWKEDRAMKSRFIAACIRHRLIDPITTEACRAVYRHAAKALATRRTEAQTKDRAGHPNPDMEHEIRCLEIRLAHMEARLAGDDPFELEAEPGRDRPRGQARRVADIEVTRAPVVAPLPTPPVADTVTRAEAEAMAATAATKAIETLLARQNEERQQQALTAAATRARKKATAAAAPSEVPDAE